MVNQPDLSTKELPEWLQQFSDVFDEKEFEKLPERRKWDHAIDLKEGSVAYKGRVYPMSKNEQGELDKFLEKNLATGKIRHGKGEHGYPVFFINKKDGKELRLIQDYRKLNDLTIKNRYPIPLLVDLIKRISNKKVFSKLDIRWGYNNVRIKEGDEHKAAFLTNRGLFEPLVMFYGLCNAPGTFQTMMTEILWDLILSGEVEVYIDNVLIHTMTEERNRELVTEICGRF